MSKKSTLFRVFGKKGRKIIQKSQHFLKFKKGQKSRHFLYNIFTKPKDGNTMVLSEYEKENTRTKDEKNGFFRTL